jgi:mono/diheme cytochrome c family protein
MWLFGQQGFGMRHSKLMSLAVAVLICGLGSSAFSETLVERGAYLVNGIGSCGNCHSPQEADGTLTGAPFSGGPAITSPAFTVYPPNLTSDPETGIGRWTEAQIVTALREGLRPDGRVLRPPMPIALYRGMSDRDAAAIAAYLKTLPPTVSHVPPAEYHIPVPASYGPPIAGIGAPNPADKIETGRYLVEIGHCMLCHTPLNAARQPDFARQFGAGGLVLPERFSGLVTPNITPDKETGIGNWTDAEIRKSLTTGVTPTGAVLAPAMPWHYLATMTDADIDAVVVFLRTLPPIRHKVD